MKNLTMEAEHAVTDLFKNLLSPGVFKNSPVILTPALLREINYELSSFEDTVIFLGFDKFNPLLIPKNTVFEKDVWIIDSHYQSGLGVHIKGDMHFLRSEFHVKQDIMSIDGVRSLDMESYLSYREDRAMNHGIGNNTLILRDDDEQTQLFQTVLAKVPKHDLTEYLKFFPTVLYNKKDMGYIVEGDVLLQGPYLFNMPNSIHFKGDLILVDSFMPDFSNEMKIDGELTVLSYY